MTTPVRLRLILSHGAALLVGLGGAALLPKSSGHPGEALSAPKEAPGDSPDRPVGMVRLTANADFRKAYEDLALQDITQRERQELQERILFEWAEEDAAGLISFLEKKRVWPAGYDVFRQRFSKCKLAETSLVASRPDLVLDFAVQSGCLLPLEVIETAIIWNHKGDVQTVMQLIDSLTPLERGPEIATLAEKLSERMGRHQIPTTNPNTDYLRGKAKAHLKDEERIDEFLATFAMIEDETVREALAWSFGRSLADEKQDKAIVDEMLRLPAEYRSKAVEGLFRIFAHEAGMRFSEARADRRRLIESFVALGLEAGAVEGVGDLCGVQDDPRATAELADWVAGFPEDAAWKPVLDEVAENWIYYDWEGMAREVPRMPAGRPRDTMVAALLEGTPPFLLGGGSPITRFPSGGLEKSMADELRTLISDPEIRKRFGNEEP